MNEKPVIIPNNEDFFCPAPWRNVYYHLNNASPCYAYAEVINLSPLDYLNSDQLKELKQDFLNKKVPSGCHVCYTRELKGLKSTRQRIYNGVPAFYKNRANLDAVTPTPLYRLELRPSNQCNFKCRMCNMYDSSQIEYEVAQHPELLEYPPEFPPVFDLGTSDQKTDNTMELNIEELKEVVKRGVGELCFTGGEPLLIKLYYDFMDFLIENGYNNKIRLMIFSNCSVFNPIFVRKLLKFKDVVFIMSVDAVGKVAEYQRHGTKWESLKDNLIKYASLPKQIGINNAISAYSLLDFSSLARFIMEEIYPRSKTIESHCYTTVTPEWIFHGNLPQELRTRAIDEIDKSIEILNVSNFNILKKELLKIRKNLTDDPINPKGLKYFIDRTKLLDKIRQESFEKVFNYKLY